MVRNSCAPAAVVGQVDELERIGVVVVPLVVLVVEGAVDVEELVARVSCPTGRSTACRPPRRSSGRTWSRPSKNPRKRVAHLVQVLGSAPSPGRTARGRGPTPPGRPARARSRRPAALGPLRRAGARSGRHRPARRWWRPGRRGSPAPRSSGSGARHTRDAHVQRHPHDLVVDERALGAQAVRPAHVAVVGGEDHHGVVPRPAVVERLEHRAQALVGEALELDVVVEVAEPGPGVAGVDVPPQPVLLVPAPLPVRLGLGVQVVVEVGRELLDHLVVVRGRRPAAGRRPSRRRPRGPTHRRHVLGVALVVPGLVDGEPHDVVRVHERHGQEPRLRCHARVAAPALARSQLAALEAMMGSKCTPVPAHPMKCRSLPSQSANP